MSTFKQFTEGDEPAIRQAIGENDRIEGYPCPFCGGQALKQSHTDLVVDTERVEVYCDNANCDAREIVILVRRGEPKPGGRADVRALHVVDAGTDAEQEAYGYTIDRDENGRKVGRIISMGTAMTKLIGPQHDRRILERRLRNTAITVEPILDDEHAA